MTTTEQKFKPIIFSTEMVQAILSGRKTQTRRVIKDALLQKNTKESDEEFLIATAKDKYQVGDVLWVRETFQYSDDVDSPYLYKEKEIEEWKPEYFAKMKWKPSIYMPKDACRIFLEITDVRIERLQDITEADAIAEGIEETERWPEAPSKAFYKWYNHPEGLSTVDPGFSFATLWESINGDGSFSRNPYVWVVSFKRIDKPESFI